MAEVKNSFLKSKMNKDLDDRLIPNGEYREATNITVNQSDGSDVGTVQTILGNKEVIDLNTITGKTGLEVIGVNRNNSLNTIFVFVTNNNTSSKAYDSTKYSAIVSWPVEQSISNAKIIAEGNWLNFHTSFPILGINLLENLLFFTDNRNQPRKVNIDNPTGYYTTEDQISVAKYYPYQSIDLYQPSTLADAVITTKTTTAASTTNTMVLNNTTSVAVGQGVLLQTGSATEILRNTFVTAVNTSKAIVNADVTGTSIVLNSVQGAIIAGDVVQDNNGPLTPATTVVSYTAASATTGTVVISSSQTFQAGAALNFSGTNTTVFTNQNVSVASGASIKFVAAESTMQDAISEYMPVTGEGQVLLAPTSTTKFNLQNYKGYIIPIGFSVYKRTLTTSPYTITNAKVTKFTKAAALNGFFDVETDVASGVTQGSLTLSAGGTNYDEFPTVKNTTGGTGSGMTVNVTVPSSPGAVTAVTIANAGSGYEVGQTLTIVNESGNNDATFTITTLPDEVLLAIPNPYYDTSFAEKANVDYLDDKYVRFSYRYKFDDGEYSLIAPFTQPCFIPEQDGYFLDKSFDLSLGENNISDEERAYQSTEVSFMQNKVNKILLNVPLPYSAGTLNSSLKITEIDILYREAGSLAIKVVDSIELSGNFSGNDFYFQYEYGSKSPYRTLPEKETTRVFDKVPVKALSQEVISNRVVYGNFQNQHTPPNFLNYNLAATKKSVFGPFTNNLGSSSIEYPNANLKQNRNYEVGVVLADRFGRQSTVILSESQLNNLPSYLASTIYSPYRNETQQLGQAGDGEPWQFDGDSLKVTFNDLITSSFSSSLGTPGLYNGDPSSADYRPLGWYTYKIVVKQTEQDYYNAYVAPIMQGYPNDSNQEKFDTSHIALFADNINKIPRDLSELGPTQKQFRSSVKLQTRVSCDDTLASPFFTNKQFFPLRVGDIASAIGTIDDLFELPDIPGNVIGSFAVLDVAPTTENTLRFNLGATPTSTVQGIFLGISEGDEVRGINFGYKDTIITDIVTSQIPPLSGVFSLTVSNKPQSTVAGNNVSFYRSGGRNYFYNQESDPLIARISTTKQAGIVIPSEYPDSGGALNIMEVQPQESLLDIYYETTTTGLISELNQAISEGPGALVYARVEGWSATLSENTPGGTTVVSSFRAVMLDGTQIDPPANATATLVSVYEQSADGTTTNTQNALGNLYKDFFAITALGNGYFKLALTAGDPELVYKLPAINNTLKFEILFDHPQAVTSFTSVQDVDLNNIAPTIGNLVAGNAKTITSKTRAIHTFTGVNGSGTTALNGVDLVFSLDSTDTNTTLFEIDQSGILTAVNLETPAGVYNITVLLTDAGTTVSYSFDLTYSYQATAVFTPNGNQQISINNSSQSGNITTIKNFTLTIQNGDFNINLITQHQGTTTTPYSTSASASYTGTDSGSFSGGILNQAPTAEHISLTTTLGPGTYTFTGVNEIKSVINGLPAASSGLAQSIVKIQATAV